jgi:hypothetical protein
LDLRIAHHSFSLGHMLLYLELVLSATASLRCSSRVLEIVLKFFGHHAGCPSWSCGRLWLLRLGYFKLTRPKEQVSDWAWIIDHTVQSGCEKCFVILGVRLSSLPPAGQCLRHEDMEPIALAPVKESTGEIVFSQLEEAAAATGVPRQIVSDHGTDLVSGVERFCRKHRGTAFTYDIKHKTAAVLKAELQADERWLAFSRQCARTARKVRQTDLAHLSPPNQRTKARYMNIDVLINWGSKSLISIDKSPRTSEIEEKIGWLRDFRDDLKGWESLLAVVAETESFIRNEGLHRGSHRELKERLHPLANTERSKRIGSQLLSFVALEAFKAKPGERLLGSSEVIESVFGKLKHLEHHQANSGFTALLLSIGAMVSTTTAEVICKAMETVRTTDVLAWCKTRLGKSVQARKKALTRNARSEQKRDQILGAFGT